MAGFSDDKKGAHTMTQYAYARVSSKTQNLARQIDSFLGLGIQKNNIFADKLLCLSMP